MADAPGPETPAATSQPRSRQKRRPGQQPSSHGRSTGSSHRSHRHSHRHESPGSTTSSRRLHRRVSFDPGQATPLRSGGTPSSASLSRHASFDPRLGSGSGRRSRHTDSPEASWQKLVARAQNLEEALASERASRRLLAARSAQERVELLAQLSKATDDRENMEHLWRESKSQLQHRASEWDSERSSLYEELGRLRLALKTAGHEPLPPTRPPANLAVALAGVPDESDRPTGGPPTSDSPLAAVPADGSETVGAPAVVSEAAAATDGVMSANAPQSATGTAALPSVQPQPPQPLDELQKQQPPAPAVPSVAAAPAAEAPVAAALTALTAQALQVVNPAADDLARRAADITSMSSEALASKVANLAADARSATSGAYDKLAEGGGLFARLGSSLGERAFGSAIEGQVGAGGSMHGGPYPLRRAATTGMPATESRV